MSAAVRLADRVVVQPTESGVVEVCLSRADKMNALDPAMFDGLISAAHHVRHLRGVRAVVLHGEGRAFCAGLDMGSFAAMAKGEGANMSNLLPREGTIANRAQQVAWLWRELAVPVVAAVHGVAFGGGLQIALGADIRIGTPETQWSVLEAKWGLVPDMAGMPLMRELLRGDVVRDLTFTGRVVLGAEAQTLGLVTHLDPNPLERARALALEIAQRSPHAVRAAKRLLNARSDSREAELLKMETEEQVALIGSPNQIESVMAGLQKRPPRFDEVD
jgi:enoyl-CoA hydratase/carnithine racemase